jgi:hypothetical protein
MAIRSGKNANRHANYVSLYTFINASICPDAPIREDLYGHPDKTPQSNPSALFPHRTDTHIHGISIAENASKAVLKVPVLLA